MKAEYGDEYEVVESAVVDGQLVEKWKFVSYRATFARDPVDKFMIVTLVNHRVTNIAETLVGRANRQQPPIAPVQSKPDPFQQLEKLKGLHDAKIITDAEYEAKRKELLDQIR